MDSYGGWIGSFDTFITIGEANIVIGKRQSQVDMGDGGQCFSVHSVRVENIVF